MKNRKLSFKKREKCGERGDLRWESRNKMITEVKMGGGRPREKKPA